MNARDVARVLTRLLMFAVLAVSGTYLLIYLYRWEWNRALVSGTFFVVAEVALAASVLSRRLGVIERKIGDADRQARQERIRDRLDASAPGRRDRPFPWLADTGPRFGVFIPVLMGAGAVLSAAAYLLERVAGATADPLVQRSVSERMAGLQLPPGGFVPTAADMTGQLRPRRLVDDAPPAGWRRLAAWGLIVATVLVLGGGALLMLANATQARPEPDRSGQTTRIGLEVASRDPASTPLSIATLLWQTCRSRIPADVGATAVHARGGGEVLLILDHGLGRTSARKLAGCLEDAEIELVQATITELTIDTGDPDDPPVDPRSGLVVDG